MTPLPCAWRGLWRAALCLCLLCWQTLAPAAVLLDRTEGRGQPVGAQALHWVDTSGDADLNSAQAAHAAGRFEPMVPGTRSGQDEQVHWLRMEVEQARHHGDWVLALHTTAIDDVRFFGPFDARGQALAPPVLTGLVQAYATRPVANERPAMRLQLEQAGRYVVFMRLQSRSSQTLEVSAWDTVTYLQSRQHKRLFDGIVYGILFALLVYNLVLAYVFRHDSYGLYVLTCAAALFTLASFNGHVAHYLLGDWPWGQQRSNTLGSALWILFGALLCRGFLELPRRLVWANRLVWGVIAAAVMAALLALAGHTAWAQQMVETCAAAGTLLAAWAAVRVWRQGFAPAAWYLCGQALLFLSVLVVVGVNWGIINAPFLLANGLQIGVVAEMLVFAYALSARVRLLRQRQTELRREADHLAEAVATDALTGLANRVGLSQRAEQLAADQQAHAVMLLDLDRFKPVNDTYGHEVGDRLLIEVARRLQSQMREGDLVARLGGDEFVVLLGGRQTPAQLAAMAQRLCEAVQQPLLHAGHLISVDASIGIARCPEHGRTLTELLRHADAAMYRAKQAHRGFAFYEPETASA
ncbi:diguanylate cyclase domain-containing protein [Hydrogenophaga defluvii]|uniref:Diguanylate cyclase domain-containing protein n=1 Tax=Hydrogenophaga defluvii TaxID=249410 RepID=A0ABW2SDV2_9BURK